MPQTIYLLVISVVVCPIIFDIVRRSQPCKYKFDANDLRAVWLLIKSHFSAVMFLPALYILTLVVMPQLRAILRNVLLNVGKVSSLCTILFNKSRTIGLSGIVA
jgi:hypothetical protein